MKGLTAISIFLALVGWSLPANAMGPEGMWSVRDGRAKVKVETCEDGKLCGKIVWLQEPNDVRGKPLRDGNNEDVTMRNRPIIGLPIAYGMVQVEDNLWEGAVYDPERGGTYKGSMSLLSDGRLKVTGCLALFLCQSNFWQPLEEQ